MSYISLRGSLDNVPIVGTEAGDFAIVARSQVRPTCWVNRQYSSGMS